MIRRPTRLRIAGAGPAVRRPRPGTVNQSDQVVMTYDDGGIPAAMPRDLMAAVLVQSERQDRRPGLEGRSPTSPGASAPPPDPCSTLECGT